MHKSKFQPMSISATISVLTEVKKMSLKLISKLEKDHSIQKWIQLEIKAKIITSPSNLNMQLEINMESHALKKKMLIPQMLEISQEEDSQLLNISKL